MSHPDSSDLLYKFLFHLRGALYSIKSASQMAKHNPDGLSISALNWFEKWMPLVDGWISDEEKSHSLFHDDEEHDWEQILKDMAESMKDASIAYVEAKNLEVPESGIGKWVIETAMSGSEYLNKAIESVRIKDYQYLLQH